MSKDLIERVQIRNVKCLRDVEVDLAPLTVLIGKNDTGKSSFLEAISWLAWATGGRQKYAIDPDPSAMVTQGFTLQQGSVTIIHSRHGRLTVPLNARTDQGRRGPLANVQPPYRFDPAELRKPAQVGILEKHPLPPDGSNLVAAIDRLPLKQFITLQDDFLQRIPTVEEVRLESPQHGHKEIWFKLKGIGLLPARQMSDGAMLLMAFLTIVHEENAPRLIMIEEPENGIHPKQLEYIVRMLYSLTERDEAVQVILTTHSPYVLDFVGKDSVRVFSRGPDGDVSVKPLHNLRGIADMLSEGLTLGEAWYNTDEDDLMKVH